MSIRFFVIALILLFSLNPLLAGREQTCKALISNMIEHINRVKTASYTLHSAERVKGKILKATSQIKLHVHPRQLYFKNNNGVEVLYNELIDKDEALVNPNAFPYINLKLDPYRSIMRNNQHHTIFELGFHQIGGILSNAVKQSDSNFDKWFTYMGIIKFNNRDCHKIYFEYPDFKHVKYTVKSKETVRSIAQKLGVGEYRIMQNNLNISYTDYIKEGRVLKVPNVYASKTLMYIDKELNLPVYIKAFDDQGFFESYEFYDLKVNLNFTSKEFEKSFSEYGF
ncbi:MAG TPA: DUF1571 domain-containing protein [Bacteroidia bacterium]|nr:DUF1571 domain-containing protein [Bacteroidia bacterium]